MVSIQKGHTIKVHDYGFVRLVDSMGTDLDIVEAARVSYGKGSKGYDKDIKLLKFLFRKRHTSPFEMVKVKYNIKMPIFVCRQFIRHRMQNFNEISARYAELPEDYYLPEVFRTQDTVNKQGSLETIAMTDDLNIYCRDSVATLYRFAHRTYQDLLKRGIAKEMARMVLPVGIYTEFYSCWDLNNLIKYFFLRDDGHAQSEHRDYANGMKAIAELLFPETMKMYNEALNNLSHMAKAVRAAMDTKVQAAPEGNIQVEDVLLTEEEILKILTA